MSYRYHNGNDENEDGTMIRGFGHVGFLVDDLEATCKWMEEQVSRAVYCTLSLR